MIFPQFPFYLILFREFTPVQLGRRKGRRRIVFKFSIHDRDALCSQSPNMGRELFFSHFKVFFFLKSQFQIYHIKVFVKIPFNVVYYSRRAHPLSRSRLNNTFPTAKNFHNQFCGNRRVDSDLMDRFVQAPDTFYTRSEAS